jgi:hypothetical protein
MNTREEFRKLYTLFTESSKAETELNKLGIYIDESTFVSTVYGIFDIAITYLLNQEGLEILYDEVLFKDVEVESAIETLNDYFL